MPIITNPQANDPQNDPSHSKLHRDEVDAINALEGDIVKKFTKDIAGEIEDLTEKTTLHNDDLILIEDSEDIYNKKKVKKSNLSTNLSKASGSDIDTGTDNDKYVTPKGIRDSGVLNSEVAGEINAIAEKTTLADDDVFILEDSTDTYKKKRVKKSNISANLSKATGAEIDIGTDDAKYVTSKSIADSKLSYTDGVETLTNKRINARIISASSYTTDTGTSLDISVCDEFVVTAQAGALKFNNPSGTPTEGQKLIIRIKDNGTANALTYDTQFRASTDLALPTTTVLSKTLYMGFIFNNTDTKWDLVAVLNNI